MEFPARAGVQPGGDLQGGGTSGSAETWSTRCKPVFARNAWRSNIAQTIDLSARVRRHRNSVQARRRVRLAAPSHRASLWVTDLRVRDRAPARSTRTLDRRPNCEPRKEKHRRGKQGDR